ncbi:MAG TPA: CPBP family intramembrane glutamic endopeptidase [Thermoanaerobaculia bacterium]|jgi:membrane protease YdiL (CAAX protease family)|nr:CPBP family intramembrane glutamic endopeptidase [Thermoanaerobaculia bacterium]
MTSRGELLLVNLLCFGPFAAISVIELAELRSVLLFDNTRALQILGIELVCGAIALLILRKRGWDFAALGLRPTFVQTVAGMMLMLGVNLLIGGFYELTQALTNSDPGAATSMTSKLTWPVLILFTLLNPLYDELFVVAYNVEAAKESGAAFAVSLSAFVRFVCHLEQGPIAAVTILPLGLVFAAVYWRWRRLWPLVVAHGIMDFVGMIPQP